MIYAFIPARSGSTRLVDKNIRDLAGMPLIGWTLQAAMKSKKIDRVIFSSDSESYINIARSCCESFDKPLLIDHRDATHAGTKSKIFDYLKGDLLNKFPFENDDMLVQLLPTCPLRNEFHIDDAVAYSLSNKCGVFAACHYDFHVSFAFSMEDKEEWQPLMRESPMITGNTQSQSQSAYYHPNGSINCLPISLLKEGYESIYHGCKPFIMRRKYSIDIDDQDDFELANALLSSVIQK